VSRETVSILTPPMRARIGGFDKVGC